MSLVSQDSTNKCHNGVAKVREDTTIKKEKPKAAVVKVSNASERKSTTDKELKGLIKSNNCGSKLEKNNHLSKESKVKGTSSSAEYLKIQSADEKEFNAENFVATENKKNKHKNCSKNERTQHNQNTGDDKCTNTKHHHSNILDKVVFDKSFTEQNEIYFAKQVLNIKSSRGNLTTGQKPKKQIEFLKKNGAINALKKIEDNSNKQLRWRMNTGVLISLVMLNVVGMSNADDTSSFTSALTSRMIATFLGYPSTCNLGAEVRPCTLTLTCWLGGGTRLRGCGGWLFSCCGLPEPSRDTFDNSIPSSEWKYKPPSNLRLVPQRSVVPNNVFRRRVDDDVTQMDCGLPASRILQKRIIGGREARFAEFPWQAHVRISEFQCGGVLVSHRFVATAAHCVSRAHTRDIAVWLGAIDTSATHHPARKLGVIQKIPHPLFQFRMTQPDRYDIALLKLSRPITYMSHILPICLPDQDMELRGRSGVIAGWGKTDASSGHTGTNLLRSATVPILSKDQCIIWHQSKQISVEIHSEMICAGHSDGHQDACLGDSGGPLIVLDNGRYYLVGITSAGFGCGVDHQPGIYHNVKLTANWIRSVISPVNNYNDNYLN